MVRSAMLRERIMIGEVNTSEWAVRWVGATEVRRLALCDDLDDAIAQVEVMLESLEDTLGYRPKYEVVRRSVTVTHSEWGPIDA